MLDFHILDVFTTGRPLSGNQLLVLEDRLDTLSTEAMLSIAREISFAESAFVRSDGVRIFTTDEEVPQAGHPVLGLAEVCAAGADQITLRTQKGPINVRREGDRWVASQDPAEWHGATSSEQVAALLERPGDADEPVLVGATHPVGSTCGLPYALVAVVSEAALDALRLAPSAPQQQFSLYFFVRLSEREVRARMFCYEGGGWIEDVATGSAAGPLAAHLAPCELRVTQGGVRRAHLDVGAPTRTSRIDVGGAVARVAMGQWAT